MTIMEIVTIITFIGTLVALYFVILQVQIAEKTLKETRKSIEQEVRNRQISLLPKFEWIIQIDIELSCWKKDLEDESKKLKELYINQNSKSINISNKLITRPGDLYLSKYQYKNMPDWLSQLWISGAQYYFNAKSLSDYKYLKNMDFVKSRYERCDESIYAIEKLRNYIKEMVPDVILNTPASIKDSEFFSDN